ncbi:MAG: glycerol-3-phosphate acyltransferase [Erysipelotrichaceae bacterium]|nr:glycerol-3-phosphate acyltransferase [Erysipelotrichaceae bacterium]
MSYIITSLISYLIGSFNTAYFYAKAHGFDIRERGSMNAGASNIKVNFGWAAGVFTGLCDMFKAIMAMKLCAYLFPDNEVIPYLAGAMVIVDHIFPFYMGFKGGKGFASFIGLLVAVNWKLAIVVCILTVIISFTTNYIVLATLTVILIPPFYYLYMKADIRIVLIFAAIALLIGYKHRVNIKRIINHEEIGVIDKKKKIKN